MVANPPPGPPGRNPTRGQALWCEQHSAWATSKNGRYRCPHGHFVTPKDNTGDGAGIGGGSDGEHS